MMPANLWNVSLVRMTAALDPKDGSVMPVSVVDRGNEQIVMQGRALTAHRYSIRTTIPQEVWYDEDQRLLKVELRGSDGSTINTTRSRDLSGQGSNVEKPPRGAAFRRKPAAFIAAPAPVVRRGSPPRQRSWSRQL